MSEMVSSPEEQKKRCDRIADLVAGALEQFISEKGDWEVTFLEKSTRGALGIAHAFLRSARPEAVRKANIVIQNTDMQWCHFAPMTALRILIKYSALLEEESRKCLRAYVEEHIDKFMEDDLDFLGVNDNFPSMAACTLVLGGQLLNRPELVEKGKERLLHLKQLLTRRGVASEYNSPTYTPFQLLAMAEMANCNCAADREIREMALGCEHRLWADVLGHLHRETSQVAGPYSRAYANNSAGEYSGAVCVSLYGLLGENLPLNISNLMLETEKGVISADPGMVGLTDTIFSCPQELLKLALQKQYPYEMTATTEFTASTDASCAFDSRDWTEGELANYEYPAGTGRICTYMTEDYALGTATHEFHNGIQTDSFHLLYRRSAPVTGAGDVGTVYARYLVNEKTPAQDMVLLEDDGRKLGIQHQNTAMLLYKPKPFLKKDVHSLKLTLVFPGWKEGAGEVWLGDRRMEGQDMEAKESCSVFIRDGSVYMAFHPLLLTDHGRKAAVTAKLENGFLLVSFYNYQGAVRDFDMREMLLTGNGFVAEVGSCTQNGDFETFRKASAKFELQDEWQSTIHSRYSTLRKTLFQRNELRIACEYSPVTEGIKQISVNDRPLTQEKLHITGFDCSGLPF